MTHRATPKAAYIELLRACLARSADKPAVRYQGRDILAGEFLASIFRYARALASIGIGRGSLVALFAPNSPDALAIRYATNLLGAGAVFLSVPRSNQRRAELLTQIDPTLLVVFRETSALLPDGITIPVAVVGTTVTDALPRLDELAASQPSDPMPSLARPGDLAVIISSGGTTGVPKGSWRDFTAYTAMVDVPSPADRRQLVNGRLAYLSQVLVDITLLGGGCVVLKPGYDAADTLATIESERITDLFLVEPQLFDIMDHPDVSRRDLSSLRALSHIGASAPPTLRRRARARLGPRLAHSYGASEMGIVSSLSPAEYGSTRPQVFTSAGRVHPGVDVRLRREDGTLAGPGKAGSIEVRSPAMAGGYWHSPALQAERFRAGWYHSGDLGRLDADGYLHILGRAADVTWQGGVMVSPTLLEDTLCRLPEVRYAVVVPDQDTGSWVAAVVAWPGLSVDPARYRDAIAARYGAEVAAAQVIVPLERVPLTEQGKPDREAIRTCARQDGVASA